MYVIEVAGGYQAAIESFLASGLTTSKYANIVSLIKSRSNIAVPIMRATIRTDSITGGDGTSKVSVSARGFPAGAAQPADGGNTGDALSIKPSVGATAPAASVDVVTGAAPGDVTTELLIFMAISPSVGALLPLPSQIAVRIANPGAAYTGGTVYLDGYEMILPVMSGIEF